MTSIKYCSVSKESSGASAVSLTRMSSVRGFDSAFKPLRLVLPLCRVLPLNQDFKVRDV